MSKTKVTANFSTDAFLMYLIQHTTKNPTDEILGFFHDFGIKVLEIGVENMTGSSIRKDIRDFYPGTVIPFKMLVTGHKSHGTWNPSTKSYDYNEKSFNGRIEVCFPSETTYVDNTQLMDMIMEKALLGGTTMPDFEKPEARTPKMYKKLIEEVLYKRNNGKTVCDT